MNILICVKTVRFLQAQTGSDPKQLNIATGDYAKMMNPTDATTIEEALRIKEQQPETEIAIMSLGGPSAEIGFRHGLAMGADRAIHIVYDNCEALDSWATATILAAWARRRDFQLILCGREAIDSNAGLVGPYLAVQLTIPHILQIVKIAPLGSDGKITAERRLNRGDRETVECSGPVLLTVEVGINVPRIPGLSAMLQARKRRLHTLTLADLASPGAPLGLAANRSKIIRLSKPKPKRSASAQLRPVLSAADRAKLMMKGSGVPALGPAKSDTLLEGCSEDVLLELERVLKSSGVGLKPPYS